MVNRISGGAIPGLNQPEPAVSTGGSVGHSPRAEGVGTADVVESGNVGTATSGVETARANPRAPAPTAAERQHAVTRTGTLEPMLCDSVACYQQDVIDRGNDERSAQTPEQAAEQAAGIVFQGDARANVIALSLGPPNSLGDVGCACLGGAFLRGIGDG
ncbi:MAG: hypothetical protein AAFX94_12200 [Myxococcota bacterium]